MVMLCISRAKVVPEDRDREKCGQEEEIEKTSRVLPRISKYFEMINYDTT